MPASCGWLIFVCRIEREASGANSAAEERSMRMFAITGCLGALVGSTYALRADDAKPQTHTVTKGPLKSDLVLEGVFEPRESREIVLRPESWTDLTVREAIEPG